MKEVEFLVAETKDKFDKRKKLYNEFTVKRVLAKFNIIEEKDIYLNDSINDLINKKTLVFNQDKISELFNILDESSANILKEYQKHNNKVVKELEESNFELQLSIRELESKIDDISEQKYNYKKYYEEEKEQIKSITELLHSLQQEKNELKKDVQNLNMKLNLRK